MSNIFFTADTHFGHNKVRIPVERPWQNKEEMDSALIQNWNSKIQPNDIVYHLGDFAKNQEYENVKNYLRQLNGKIILISGNHDVKFSDSTKRLFFEFHKHQYELCVSVYELYILNHCPMLEWNKSHHNSFHLFGHCHGVVDNIGKAWDVGVDNNKYFPLSIEEVRTIMTTRPDNKNYRKRDNLFDFSKVV